MSTSYARDRFSPRRRPTRVVMIGSVPVGGDEPIRVQSMTTTLTYDVPATVEQIARLERAGCEIARVTVPSLRDAQALPEIRAEMTRRGIALPLVADIHFSPKMAMMAVEQVEKVRVNPGNFTDTKRFEQHAYSDEEYAQELVRIEEKFAPLVLRARERGISMRIGTNHGSLSDRIMNRYGDSPEGMVESALEFVRICRKHDYHQLVISMKASNTRIMVEAYRLLALQMEREGMDYPFHLGVTEAGDGDPARIKSAIGIGGLLQDGIGDTIRVSLTEDPVREVPVAFALAGRAGPRLKTWFQVPGLPAEQTDWRVFQRRPTRRIEQGTAAAALGGDQELRVEVELGRPGRLSASVLRDQVLALAGSQAGDRRAELIGLTVEDGHDLAALRALRTSVDEAGVNVALDARAARAVWSQPGERETLLGVVDRLTPVGITAGEVRALASAVAAHEDTALLLQAAPPVGGDLAAACAALADMAQAALEAGLSHLALGLRAEAPRAADEAGPLLHAGAVRALAATLDARGLDLPLVLEAWGGAPDTARDARQGDQGLLDAATAAGGLLVDGIGDAVRLTGFQDPARALDLAYGVLQGARRRTTETEYISCPGCGRTLFDLEPVTARIKALTNHLKGVKIGVMGCVVNGPGEMADADFGYVGWKPGKVNLYVGRECVVREIDDDEAPERLVQLIKDHGRWTEPRAGARERALPVAR